MAEGQRDGKRAARGCPAQALQVLLITQRHKSAWGNALGGKRLAANSGKGQSALKHVLGESDAHRGPAEAPRPHGRRSPRGRRGAPQHRGQRSAGRARAAPRPCAGPGANAASGRQPLSGAPEGREKEKRQLYGVFSQVSDVPCVCSETGCVITGSACLLVTRKSSQNSRKF